MGRAWKCSATVCLSAMFLVAHVPTVLGACAGDCNANGMVEMDEIVTGVEAALGRAAACAGVDRGDGVVQVDDLVTAVHNARTGCPADLAGNYAATVIFDSSHRGIINLTADRQGEIDGSIVVESTARRFQARLSFNFPIAGMSVALTGPYDPATGGFEVSGSYLDSMGNSVPVVISGNLPGPTGSVPVNVYVGTDPNDVFVAMLSAGMLATPTPVPSVTPGPSGEPRIVFSGARASAGGLTKVFFLNSDGSGERRLTSSTVPQMEVHPVWSPDGSRIALSVPEGSGHAIAVVNADGSNLRVLTEGGLYNLPTWSPDGAQIAFSFGDGIIVMNADGSNRRTVLRRLAGDEYRKMSWSPDGSRIAFASTRGKPTNHDTDFEIFTMRPDGSDIRQLTDNNVPDHNPAWRPDGAKIAFDSNRPAPTNIWLMNPDGSQQTKLTNDFILGVSAPAWSQDGSQIAYGGFFGITIAAANGTAPRTVPNTGMITDFDLR